MYLGSKQLRDKVTVMIDELYSKTDDADYKAAVDAWKRHIMTVRQTGQILIT